jgi:hypothetical protein
MNEIGIYKALCNMPPPWRTTDLNKGETHLIVWGLEEDKFNDLICPLDDFHFNNVRPDVSF